MKKIKLIVLLCFISILSFGQTIDQVLNSTLLGMNRQDLYNKISTLDSVWNFKTGEDKKYGDYILIVVDSLKHKEYRKEFTFYLDEYGLVYMFISNEIYNKEQCEKYYNNIVKQMDKYGHLENNKLFKKSKSYIYYVNNFVPIFYRISLQKEKIDGVKYNKIFIGSVVEKPKKLELYYDIINMYNEKNNKKTKNYKNEI